MKSKLGTAVLLLAAAALCAIESEACRLLPPSPPMRRLAARAVVATALCGVCGCASGCSTGCELRRRSSRSRPLRPRRLPLRLRPQLLRSRARKLRLRPMRPAAAAARPWCPIPLLTTTRRGGGGCGNSHAISTTSACLIRTNGPHFGGRRGHDRAGPRRFSAAVPRLTRRIPGKIIDVGGICVSAFFLGRMSKDPKFRGRAL